MSEVVWRRLAAEFLGTLLLLATVVGSGIMAAKLAQGNVAVALLANALATGAMLVVLITVFGPVSGAHFNPVVTAAFALRGEVAWPHVPLYLVAQVLGACAGVLLANAMFDLAILQVSTTARGGTGQWLSEIVATSTLLIVIFGTLAHAPNAVPVAVGLTITGAYWFTASTSFANPAVTLARALSDTFAGIAPGSVPGFLIAQTVGLAVGLAIVALIWPRRAE